jgi:hypothetical protein
MKISLSLFLIFCFLGLIKNLALKKEEVAKANDQNTLEENKKLISKNGKYTAVMQTDGNFVIYSEINGTGNPIWASNTGGLGKGPYRLIMQEDGNLCVYDSAKTPIWTTNTQGIKKGPYKLIMHDDGNLIVYSSDKSIVWASNTKGKI